MRTGLVVARRSKVRQRTQRNILHPLGLLQTPLDLGFEGEVLLLDTIANAFQVELGPDTGVQDRRV